MPSGNPKADTCSKVDGMARQALNFASEALAYEPSGAVVMNHTMRPGLGYDSGRSSTALTSEKIAVLAPTPSASVRTATRVKPGLRRQVRPAYRKSCATDSNENSRRRAMAMRQPTSHRGSGQLLVCSGSNRNEPARLH